jgi:hypothetical protein
MVGITLADSSTIGWLTPNSWAYWYTGSKYNNNTAASYGASFALNDIIGIALDMDAGTVTFYKNGVSQGTAYSGLTGSIVPYFGSAGGGVNAIFTANFGQRPFAYTAPSGFKALNTQNLPTPTIGATPATQANKYFDVVLRNGGGTSGGTYATTINMANGAWLWDKPRNQASDNYLVDSVRGLTKFLSSNQTSAEITIANWFTGFNNGSFTTGSNDWGSGVSIVDWIWAASGAGVTNTAGSITSTVSANTTSGFSVVTWTSNGTSGIETMGHGLGVAPAMIITKNRSAVSNWITYHTSLGNNQYLSLNTTSAALAFTPYWSTSSTTWGQRQSGIASNGDSVVAY